MFGNHSLPRNIIIALGIALIVAIALVATARYFIVRDKRAVQNPPAQRSVPIPEDVLRSLTPPKDAKPVVVDQAILDSLTPPAR